MVKREAGAVATGERAGRESMRWSGADGFLPVTISHGPNSGKNSTRAHPPESNPRKVPNFFRKASVVKLVRQSEAWLDGRGGWVG